MGIVNLGADSFSGDGLTDIDAALALAVRHVAEGADLIDVGAESARTNREPIPVEVEAKQLRLFLERWPEARASVATAGRTPPLSINTWRPEVARSVLPWGGDLLNDIGGLPNDENARICAGCGAALLIMHTVGAPKVPHTHVRYPDVMRAMDDFFADKMELAQRAGLEREAILLDPGLDFAKQLDANLRVLRELPRLEHFARPLLLAASRKTFIGEVLGLPQPAERDAGTVACLVAGSLGGARIFRVHRVRAAVEALRIVTAVDGFAPVETH